ncbi:MAG: MATE family efflux transporter [Lachnospiraceae bacterium]|nr:MATE family efflux transporter [Lachnospiraceae bacterium]
MSKKYVKDMTTGSPTKLLLSFSLPLVVGNVFQQFYNMVDSIIVGKYVGAEALAAVGATGSLNFLFFSLCAGMASGIGIIISQCFGAGDTHSVKRTIVNAAYIMLVCGIGMGVLGFLLARPILLALNTPENILADATLYMKICCAGTICVATYNCIASILRGVGDSKSPLYFLIVASVLNIALDLYFVKGLNMGVAGVAYATIISQFVSGVLCIAYAFAKNPLFRFSKEHLGYNRVIVSRCVRMGVPLAFQTSLITISCVALQSVVNSFGSTVVAAYTATSRIEQVVQQPFNSLGVAISTYTGQNIGARRFDRVKKGFIRSYIIMAIFTLSIVPLAWIFGDQIVSVFVNDSEIIELGGKALRITSIFYLSLGTIYVTRGLLNGASDAKYAFINGCVEMFGRICFTRPLTLIPFIGVWGVWLATALTWFITALAGLIRYKTTILRRESMADNGIAKRNTGFGAGLFEGRRLGFGRGHFFSRS